MTNTSFLNKIAKLLLDNYSDQLSDTVIVLPNKRAKVFLIEAIKNQLSQTVISPEIISIEDFVQHIAGIRSVDAIEQLFETKKKEVTYLELLQMLRHVLI